MSTPGKKGYMCQICDPTALIKKFKFICSCCGAVVTPKKNK